MLDALQLVCSACFVLWSAVGHSTILGLEQWRIQGGQFGTPLNGAPSPYMRPFLVPVEVETEIKNTLK